MDNDFLLFDRIEKIKSVINQYGEENFYLSFSGGKDSTILHYLIDMAIPNNQIPRVYSNTGIELNMIRDFVYNLQKNDKRIIILKPQNNIKKILEEHGYPFKSKDYSAVLSSFQNGNKNGKWINNYLNSSGKYSCPKKLKYQFSDDFKIKISDKCCYFMKEKPLDDWKNSNNKPYSIIGIMPVEGGRRSAAKCMAFKRKGQFNFQPLVPLNKEWEDWFVSKYNIKLCDLYYPPYNFPRTGCKGCPFNINLQKSLNTLEEFFPDERKQCEYIWKPIYTEYRRIKYRLKDEYYHQITFEEFIKNENKINKIKKESEF